MPIEFPRHPFRPAPRKAVAWLRCDAPINARNAFTARGFGIHDRLADNEIRDSTILAGVCAAVFTQDTERVSMLRADLNTFAPMLLQHDCTVLVRVDKTGDFVARKVLAELKLSVAGADTDTAEAPSFRGAATPAPYARILALGAEWNDVANVMLESPPGPAPNFSLVISPKELADSLPSEHVLLVRRAFADCASVSLEPLTPGRSGATLFRAHAELRETDWPQPFFVKLGPRKKIFAEYRAYELFVNPYIPFQLGPRLDRDRCGLGSAAGILVGDFVDGAERLLECACEGRSTSAISCLFDKTLLAWYRSPKLSTKSIPELLGDLFPDKIVEERKALAQSFGSTLDEVALRKLFEKENSHVLVGRVHGDLHSNNILVRANDAIVIDFYSQRSEHPLVWDAANLEASLLVEGFPASLSSRESPDDMKSWVESLTPLYAGVPLELGVTTSRPADSCYWFYMCVHQIRRYAREWGTQRQYAAALALALLIKAKKDATGVPEPEASRRAAAYYFAERLLTATFCGEST